MTYKIIFTQTFKDALHKNLTKEEQKVAINRINDYLSDSEKHYQLKIEHIKNTREIFCGRINRDIRFAFIFGPDNTATILTLYINHHVQFYRKFDKKK